MWVGSYFVDPYVRPEAKMSGIVMFKTGDPERVRDFYLDRVHCEPWMDYENSFVLRNGNFLFGFQESEQPDSGGMLTFFFGFTEEVDDIFPPMTDAAVHTIFLPKIPKAGSLSSSRCSLPPTTTSPAINC